MRRAGLALATLAALVLLGAGAVAGQALTTAGLRGRVVLVEFWTYG